MNTNDPLILVIDDNKISNFICEKIIEQYSQDCLIMPFVSSEKGLDAILTHRNSISLLFIDLSMPVYDGWEVMSKMQNEQIEIPTIVLTSSINEEDRLKTKSFPFVVHYMIKPPSYEFVIDLLNKHLPMEKSNG